MEGKQFQGIRADQSEFLMGDGDLPPLEVILEDVFSFLAYSSFLIVLKQPSIV